MEQQKTLNSGRKLYQLTRLEGMVQTVHEINKKKTEYTQILEAKLGIESHHKTIQCIQN
jgi:hypothetical protein